MKLILVRQSDHLVTLCMLLLGHGFVRWERLLRSLYEFLGVGRLQNWVSLVHPLQIIPLRIEWLVVFPSWSLLIRHSDQVLSLKLRSRGSWLLDGFEQLLPLLNLRMIHLLLVQQLLQLGGFLRTEDYYATCISWMGGLLVFASALLINQRINGKFNYLKLLGHWIHAQAFLAFWLHKLVRNLLLIMLLEAVLRINNWDD